jgi:hypothetical protein
VRRENSLRASRAPDASLSSEATTSARLSSELAPRERQHARQTMSLASAAARATGEIRPGRNGGALRTSDERPTASITPPHAGRSTGQPNHLVATLAPQGCQVVAAYQDGAQQLGLTRLARSRRSPVAVGIGTQRDNLPGLEARCKRRSARRPAGPAAQSHRRTRMTVAPWGQPAISASRPQSQARLSLRTAPYSAARTALADQPTPFSPEPAACATRARTPSRAGLCARSPP